MLEKIFSEKFLVRKIIFLCVGTLVCKEFEKFKSSCVWERKICAVEFKDFEDLKFLVYGCGLCTVEHRDFGFFQSSLVYGCVNSLLWCVQTLKFFTFLVWGLYAVV